MCLSRLVCFRGPPSTLESESRNNVADTSALKLKANLEKMIPETGTKENVATFKPMRALEKSCMAKAEHFVCPLGLKNRHKLVLTVSWRRRSMLDKLDTVLLALDELVDGGVILEIEPSAIVNRVGMRGASSAPLISHSPFLHTRLLFPLLLSCTLDAGQNPLFFNSQLCPVFPKA